MHCPGFVHQAGFHAILPGGWQVYPAPNTMQALTRIPGPEKTSRPEGSKQKKNKEEKERFNESLIVEIITAWKRRIRRVQNVGVAGTCRVRSADVHRARKSAGL
jgi:hypothetical protein